MPRCWAWIILLAWTVVSPAWAQGDGSEVPIRFRIYPPDASVYHVTATSKKFLGRANQKEAIRIPEQWTEEHCIFAFERSGFSFPGQFGWGDLKPGRDALGVINLPVDQELPIEGKPNSSLVGLFTYIRFNPLPVFVPLALLAFGGAYWVKGRNERAVLEALTRKREALTAQYDGTDPLVGKTLGRYLLIDRLGEGGMATVYKAVPEQTLELKDVVAIKVMQTKMAEEPDFRRRFEREVRLSRDLTHPNIIRVDDWGEHNGMLYLVLEYVPGETLDRKIPRNGMSLEEAMLYLEPAAEALIYAHGRGVMHRDLKPENIMVSRDGALKIMDFGLARTQKVTSKVTKTGSAMGTPAYMAPEQITGAMPRPTVDQYAFGVMAYELLTGRRPFDDDNADLMSVLHKHLSVRPPSPREWKPSISEDLEELILRMLEKEPTHRLASLEVVQEGLRAIASGRAWKPPPKPVVPPRNQAQPSAPPGAAAKTAVKSEQPVEAEQRGAGESTVGVQFVPNEVGDEGTVGFQFVAAPGAADDKDGTVGFQVVASEVTPDLDGTVGFQVIPIDAQGDDDEKK